MTAAETTTRRNLALVESAVTQAVTQVGTQTNAFIEEGAKTARTSMETTMQQATKTAEGFYKAAGEAAEFGRGNLDALTRATQALTTGMQEMGRQFFAMSQAMSDHAMESAKALSAVKSLKEATDIQTAFARASMERSMTEGAKLQEAAFRLAEQAGAPLAAQMTLAAERFAKPLAA